MNIRDMFRLIVEFEFNFMINSQIYGGIMIQFLHWQSISSSGRKMPDCFCDPLSVEWKEEGNGNRSDGSERIKYG